MTVPRLLLGLVTPSSSAEPLKDYDTILKTVVDLFNCSPLGKQLGNLLCVVDILIKLVGMHSDHCSKEKKDVEDMKKKKMDAILQILGEKEILDKSTEELLSYFLEAYDQMIKNAVEKLNEIVFQRMRNQNKMQLCWSN